VALLTRTSYDTIELLSVDANPNGSISASTGSLAVSTNGDIYKNLGGTSWNLFLTGSSSGVPVQPVATNVTINPSKFLGSVYAENGSLGGEFGATITTVAPNDDSIPQYTEGEVILTSPSYTVKSSTSKIRVIANTNGAISTGGSLLAIHTHRSDDGGSYAANAEGSSFGTISGSSFGTNVNLAYQVNSPGAGVVITYKLVAGPSAGTLSINGALGSRNLGGKYLTTILIQEIES
jgi:hypothetical protein